MNQFNLVPYIKTELKFTVIINSFNEKESNQSKEIVEYLRLKNIVYQEVDINQEQKLSIKEKKTKNIREDYYVNGFLAYINQKLVAPQLIINQWRFDYNQFKFLLEIKYLDKILCKKACEHVRFFEEDEHSLRIVHFREKFKIHCVYCLSERKIKPKIQVLCNFRNYKDIHTDEVLSYIEDDETISVEIYDLDNPLHFSNEKQKYFSSIFNKNDKRSPIIVVNGQIVELGLFLNGRIRLNICLKCGKKLVYSDICICCIKSKELNQQNDEKRIVNLSFIQKLNLKMIYKPKNK